MERALGISKDCFIVRGYLRSAIYDTRRQTYALINNRCANDLCEFAGKSEVYVREHIDPELLQFILDNEFGYFWPVEVLNQFADISLAYDHHALINNSIIEGTDLRAIYSLNLLLKAGCRYFLMILHNTVSFDELDKYMTNIRFEAIPTLELHLNSVSDISIKKIKNFIHKFPFIASLSVYNEKREHFFVKNQIPVAITKRNFPKIAPVKSPDIFFVNLQMFVESNHHNPYFHRKIHISKNGEIRNAPEYPQVFGNINDLNSSEQIAQILCEPDFQRYWHISKDRIDVCRD